MKFSDFVGVVVISAVVSVGVYLYLDHKKAEEEVPVEKSNEEHPEEPSVEQPPQKELTKKKSLFDRIKSKTGEALVTKKLLDEVDDRDVTITIELNKK